jgi:hypothetical protein
MTSGCREGREFSLPYPEKWCGWGEIGAGKEKRLIYALMIAFVYISVFNTNMR